MTTFTYPVNIKHTGKTATGAGAVDGKTPFYMQRKVSVGDTGTAVGSTTIPLFIAPSGYRVWDATLDVITGYNQGASNTNLAVGVGTSTGIVFAATTVNTAGRRNQTMTGAQVSANAIVFTANTTIEAIISIDTSTVTAGEVLITVILI